ncbi:hypothetical protein EJ03DRAFT_87887 [Teratosphaeria nubilosa]|uniref:Zn(2)-C6 fungal-type domain-containing protein n=1 Tax=Teratosphaeria nubilosa TaxID=161662 RepID=A0A6G1LA79_9PEZI|nr:hypothetical protein EJ03DRAFT_87887 [Teratosphaeria nubilosa]
MHGMEPAPAKTKKHTRTAIACRRCKLRKQKCNGQHPVCSNCKASDAICEYDISNSLARSRAQYLRALQRIEELEGILQQAGIPGHGSKDWRECSELKTEEAGGMSESLKSASSFVDVLRDLSLDAGGGYVGASSNITMARMLSTIIKAKEESLSSSSPERHNLMPKSLNGHGFGDSADAHTVTFMDIDPELADRMIHGYFRHISTLWPIFDSGFVRSLHSSRQILTGTFERAILHLIYAAGGRFLETTGETGDFRSEEHYSIATGMLDDVLRFHDIRSVQMLLLLAVYSLRAPKGPGAWSFVGLAMRLAIDLGLHRRTRGSQSGDERRRCVFWSAYCLDRQISIILGRPFAISDRDIDVELPVGSHEPATPTALVATTSSAMECFIHICRLRIIESHIQQSIYRVDRPTNSTEELDAFLDQLEAWKLNIPIDAQLAGPGSINGQDYYMVYFYKCLRFLLHPHISAPDPHLHYLERCVEACAGVCQTYKRLHQNVTVGFSLMALHSVFFAGLTLLYCSWLAPKQIFTMRTVDHITSCSIVLYIIAERWPGARTYRDIFEIIRQSVAEAIEKGDYQPRFVIKSLEPEMQDALRDMQTGEGSHEDFSALVMEMSGSRQKSERASSDPGMEANSSSVLPGLAFDFSLPASSAANEGMQLDGDNLDWLASADVTTTV